MFAVLRPAHGRMDTGFARQVTLVMRGAGPDLELCEPIVTRDGER
jgi:hypothetical protein